MVAKQLKRTRSGELLAELCADHALELGLIANRLVHRNLTRTEAAFCLMRPAGEARELAIHCRGTRR